MLVRASTDYRCTVQVNHLSTDEEYVHDLWSASICVSVSPVVGVVTGGKLVGLIGLQGPVGRGLGGRGPGRGGRGLGGL